jgi:hypothetical protein
LELEDQGGDQNLHLIGHILVVEAEVESMRQVRLLILQDLLFRGYRLESEEREWLELVSIILYITEMLELKHIGIQMWLLLRVEAEDFHIVHVSGGLVELVELVALKEMEEMEEVEPMLIIEVEVVEEPEGLMQTELMEKIVVITLMVDTVDKETEHTEELEES